MHAGMTEQLSAWASQAACLLRPSPVLPHGEYDLAGGVRTALAAFLCLTVARVAFNLIMMGRSGPSEPCEDATPQEWRLEEVWQACGAICLWALAAWAEATGDSPCSALDAGPCAAGWPNVGVSARGAFVLEAQMGWYAHKLVAPWINLALFPSIDSALHGMAAFSGSALAYRYDGIGIAVAATTAFAAPPLLGATRLIRPMGRARGPVALIGCVVFAGIAVLAPIGVMKGVVVDGLGAAREAGGAWGVYCGGVALLAVLYGLQCWWLLGALRRLRQTEEAGEEGAVQDGRGDEAKKEQ
ncbi:unnamed protein product [Ostreobium quekettii]|uniref:Uncharacterized protein n=1 Tax=Ostreobium quekettii TaxID=121088 RepID=A0A8S1J4I0_9CHLO|nr:unnamed protein product [Ostreobium quekettii]